MTGSDDPFHRQRAAAAARHAERFLSSIAASSTPDQPWLAGIAVPPPWLITGWQQHLDRYAEGHGLKCVHLHEDLPELCHVALWAPGITVCTLCVDDGALQVMSDERDEKAAHTCDGCGAYVAAGLHTAAYKHQSTLIWFGVCPSCRDDLHITPDPDHTVGL